jgi:hypothetical protein
MFEVEKRPERLACSDDQPSSPHTAHYAYRHWALVFQPENFTPLAMPARNLNSVNYQGR